MDFKSIQEFLRFVNKSDLTEVELEQGDFKLKIKRKPGGDSGEALLHSFRPPQIPFDYAGGTPAFPTQQTQQPQQPLTGDAPQQTKAESVANGNLFTIVSPMVGTFYRSPSPDKDDFVKVGDTLAVGQTLCIIEAMKLFNEIESEVAGKVVKILVANAQPVEYDTPLFLVELTK